MASLNDLRENVGRILYEHLGDSVSTLGTGDFVVNHQSTKVHVRCLEQGSDDHHRTLVRLISPVLRDVQPSPELFEFIAYEGVAYVFGALSLHAPGVEAGTDELVTITMHHTLLGNFLDEEELIQALVTISLTADFLDDELRQRFGGSRAVD